MLCQGARLSRNDLERMVFEQIRNRFAWVFSAENEAALERTMRGMLDGDSGAGVPEADLRRRLGEVLARINSLVKSVSPENLSLLDTHLTKLRVEKEQIERELKSVGKIPGKLQKAAEDKVRKGIEIFHSLGERILSDASDDDRKSFYHAFIQRIKISPKDGIGKLILRSVKGLNAVMAGAAGTSSEPPLDDVSYYVIELNVAPLLRSRRGNA